ncbi:Splicing factor 3B subunit 5 [Mucor velutinosus]|uniref:Splicing factor 3B subunit 5 n=1 Tax=Mucor velutinosus TaxID=708070 RepID=A0AAN7DSG7_9FUNG|nr:Splicing factor 3B subunit 5 [Mucor velutinosus]
MILNQLQEQLTSVTARVNEHDGLLARLDTLEKENSELKKLLQDKDLAIQKLQGAVSAKQAKKRLAIGRAFTTAARKGPQGYQYVYIGRSKKIARSEVRSLLRKAGVDLGRVLDICFPASDVIGILVHVQYVQDFTALLEACEAEFFFDFDPLDPANIADPKYDSLTLDQRTALIMEFTAARCLQTLAFLRPLNVSGVGKYFVEQGWICDEDLSVSVGDAIQRFAKKEPKRANFLFRRKINADSANEDSAMEQ